jgi:hypothetical protein
MSKQLVMRTWIVMALALSGVAACGGGKAGPAPAGSGTAAATTGDGSAASAPAPTPAVERALVLRHGPMTWVMDTPRNQLEKAGVALEGSGFVAAVRARGITVTLEGDEALDGVVLLAGGEELARAELEGLDGKEVPADLLATVDAHFGTTP